MVCAQVCNCVGDGYVYTGEGYIYIICVSECMGIMDYLYIYVCTGKLNL